MANTEIKLAYLDNNPETQGKTDDKLVGTKAEKVIYKKENDSYTTVHDELRNKADKATTLAGYGITDAANEPQLSQLFNAKADDDNVYSKADINNKLEIIDNTAADIKSQVTAKYTPTEEGAKEQTIPFQFAIDENGNYGYMKKDEAGGADTFFPFKSNFIIPEITFGDTDFAGSVSGDYPITQMGATGTGTLKFNCENYKYVHIEKVMLTKASWRGTGYSRASVTLQDENGTVLKQQNGNNASWSGYVNQTFNNVYNIKLNNSKTLNIACTYFACAEGESAMITFKNIIFSNVPIEV